MRARILVVAFTLVFAGCATQPAHPPKAERKEKISYNRRDLPPEPGLLTGRDGVWTLYRSDADEPPPPPPPRRRTTLECQRGQVCDPPVDPEADEAPR